MIELNHLVMYAYRNLYQKIFKTIVTTYIQKNVKVAQTEHKVTITSIVLVAPNWL